MPRLSPPQHLSFQPHPLAAALIEHLRDRGSPVRVVDFGSGHGRNSLALQNAGFEVLAIDDATAADPAAFRAIAGCFEGVLATHSLLHGTPQSVVAAIETIASMLPAGGLFFATFASMRDARYRKGRRVAAWTFAPVDGDESGVPHVYYDERSVRALLEGSFTIDSLQERSVDRTAGEWAHPTAPLHGAVHWLAKATRHAQ